MPIENGMPNGTHRHTNGSSGKPKATPLNGHRSTKANGGHRIPDKPLPTPPPRTTKSVN